MKNNFKFIDLFAGIGGFHLASSNNGGICVFASEIDKYAQEAYFANYGIQPQGDITKIEAKDIPDHDLLCAGFPCQPFSIIGKSEGFSDTTRGTLFFDIARILKEKQPKSFILENVKRLVGHDGGKTFNTILNVLKDLGYYVHYKVLNALDYGLPQKRERIVIVGFKENLSFVFPEKISTYTPLSQIIEKKPDKKHFASEDIRNSRHLKHQSKYDLSIWHENKSGNISSYPYSCALRAGASYNYLLVNGDRRLTPREMLRLQGFPDTFNIVCSDAQTRKQAGNSIPVPMIELVIREIKHAWESSSKRCSSSKTSLSSRRVA